MLTVRSFRRVACKASLGSTSKVSLAALLVGLVLVPATLLPLQGSTANAGTSAERSQSKIDRSLIRLHDLYILAGMPDDPADLNSIGPAPVLSDDGFLEFAQIYDGLVLIEAAAADADNAMQALEALGLTQGTVFDRAISGYVPILAIPDLEQIEGLTAVRMARIETAGGSVTSQGDAALFADVARATHGVDGTGVTIGVISDSYNCLGSAAADVSSGDLPSGVVVQQEETSCTSGTDEGRAMMQLIHDVAPGADLIFQTGFLGAAAMAQGILDLATAGADVIVDDLTYLTQPFFQDGVIAQAVDTVVAGGVAYFSSAGNSADQSYESDFRSGSTYAFGAFPGTPTFSGGVAHDFDPGAGVSEFQRVTFPTGLTRITLQWDQPSLSVSGGSGSANEVDFYVFDEAVSTVLAGSADFNFGGDPMEFISVQNNSGVPVTARLGIFYDNSLIQDGLLQEIYRTRKLPGAKQAELKMIRGAVGLRGVHKQWIMTEHLKHLNIPVLIVWGAQDKIIPVYHAYNAAREAPGVRVPPSQSSEGKEAPVVRVPPRSSRQLRGGAGAPSPRSPQGLRHEAACKARTPTLHPLALGTDLHATAFAP
ncbi:MAG: hypothetical protein IH961_03095, partial [Chloroflexi bacterium]|nr:hypothetical protein [Chloroflexota bacterium]